MIDDIKMQDFMGEQGIAVNPVYGTGHFNRRIKLERRAGSVVAELEDCSHAFRVILSYRHSVVSDVQAESLRYPMTGCIGAPDKLKELIGVRTDLSAREYVAKINPKVHCTHLYDLALLALAHISRDESVRVIDVVIPDELEEAVEATVSVNNRTVLTWLIRSWQIIAPYKDKPVYRGFAQWAEELLDGDEKEAGFVLQKSYMVAQARRFDADAMLDRKPGSEVSMAGVCYNYGPDIIKHTERVPNTLRDFTGVEEQLLQFK